MTALPSIADIARKAAHDNGHNGERTDAVLEYVNAQAKRALLRNSRASTRLPDRHDV